MDRHADPRAAGQGAGRFTPKFVRHRPGAGVRVSAICAARGCTAPATWELRWNNPKLHTPDRRKVWLACDAHKESLSDFLSARSFLRDVVAHHPDDPT
jgi:hypothetical protein